MEFAHLDVYQHQKTFSKNKHRIRANNQNSHGPKQQMPGQMSTASSPPCQVGSGSRRTLSKNISHLMDYRFSGPQIRTNQSNRPSVNMYSASIRNQDVVPFCRDHFVYSRFRFVVRNDVGISESANNDTLPEWSAVEIVRYPTEDPELEQCPICLDQPPCAPHVTRCGHLFCQPCLTRHLQFNSKCPLCFNDITAEEMRSVEFDQVVEAEVGDHVVMSLMTRGRKSIVPRPVNEKEGAVFARVTKTHSLESLRRREATELQTALDECQCSETETVIRACLALSANRVNLWQGRKSSSENPAPESQQESVAPDENNSYYFYQASSGALAFLDHLNFRCLLAEFGSVSQFPLQISGRVVQIKKFQQSVDVRGRFRFLRHLPLTTSFRIIEIEMDEYLSQATLFLFADEIQSRKAGRREAMRLQQCADRRHRQTVTSSPITIPRNIRGPTPVPSIDMFPSLSPNVEYCEDPMPYMSPPSWMNDSLISTSMQTMQSNNNCISSPISMSFEFDEEIHEDLCDDEKDEGYFGAPPPVNMSPPDWNEIHKMMTSDANSTKQKSKFKPLFSNGSSRSYKA